MSLAIGRDQARERELAALGKSESDIVATEVRITEQMALLRRLHAGGQDSTLADDLLSVLNSTLSALQHHRQLIFRNIARIDAGRLDRSEAEPAGGYPQGAVEWLKGGDDAMNGKHGVPL